MARYIYAIDMELVEQLRKKNKPIATGFSHAGKQFKIDGDRLKDFALETDTPIVDPHIHNLVLIKDSGVAIPKENAKDAAAKAVLKDQEEKG